MKDERWNSTFWKANIDRWMMDSSTFTTKLLFLRSVLPQTIQFEKNTLHPRVMFYGSKP
jgi:hypothetical protein